MRVYFWYMLPRECKNQSFRSLFTHHLLVVSLASTGAVLEPHFPRHFPTQIWCFCSYIPWPVTNVGVIPDVDKSSDVMSVHPHVAPDLSLSKRVHRVYSPTWQFTRESRGEPAKHHYFGILYLQTSIAFKRHLPSMRTCLSSIFFMQVLRFKMHRGWIWRFP